MPRDVNRDLHADLSEDLDRILARFKPGAKATLIVRSPDLDDADVVFGNDDIELAIAAARSLESRRCEPDGRVRVIDTQTRTRLQ
jgi:hypothetical protein